MIPSFSRLVVVGATGSVGWEVVKQALARKIKVLAISRNASKIAIKDDNLETADVDISKEGALLAVLHENDTAVFCAANFENQEPLIRNSFKAFETKGIKRVVLSGGVTMLKIDETRTFIEDPYVQKKYPFLIKFNQLQHDVVNNTKVDWTEVDFGPLIVGEKSPEIFNSRHGDFKVIPFAKTLVDFDHLSIHYFYLYALSVTVANKIIDLALQHTHIRQRIGVFDGVLSGVKKPAEKKSEEKI